MTEREHESEREPGGVSDEELLEEQQGKGYGEDEGEREESLPDE